jgi:hypothetical protein
VIVGVVALVAVGAQELAAVDRAEEAVAVDGTRLISEPSSSSRTRLSSSWQA